MVSNDDTNDSDGGGGGGAFGPIGGAIGDVADAVGDAAGDVGDTIDGVSGGDGDDGGSSPSPPQSGGGGSSTPSGGTSPPSDTGGGGSPPPGDSSAPESAPGGGIAELGGAVVGAVRDTAEVATGQRDLTQNERDTMQDITASQLEQDTILDDVEPQRDLQRDGGVYELNRGGRREAYERWQDRDTVAGYYEERTGVRPGEGGLQYSDEESRYVPTDSFRRERAINNLVEGTDIRRSDVESVEFAGGRARFRFTTDAAAEQIAETNPNIDASDLDVKRRSEEEIGQRERIYGRMGANPAEVSPYDVELTTDATRELVREQIADEEGVDTSAVEISGRSGESFEYKIDEVQADPMSVAGSEVSNLVGEASGPGDVADAFGNVGGAVVDEQLGEKFLVDPRDTDSAGEYAGELGQAYQEDVIDTEGFSPTDPAGTLFEIDRRVQEDLAQNGFIPGENADGSVVAQASSDPGEAVEEGTTQIFGPVASASEDPAGHVSETYSEEIDTATDVRDAVAGSQLPGAVAAGAPIAAAEPTPAGEAVLGGAALLGGAAVAGSVFMNQGETGETGTVDAPEQGSLFGGGPELGVPEQPTDMGQTEIGVPARPEDAQQSEVGVPERGGEWRGEEVGVPEQGGEWRQSEVGVPNEQQSVFDGTIETQQQLFGGQQEWREDERGGGIITGEDLVDPDRLREEELQELRQQVEEQAEYSESSGRPFADQDAFLFPGSTVEGPESIDREEYEGSEVRDTADVGQPAVRGGANDLFGIGVDEAIGPDTLIGQAQVPAQAQQPAQMQEQAQRQTADAAEGAEAVGQPNLFEGFYEYGYEYEYQQGRRQKPPRPEWPDLPGETRGARDESEEQGAATSLFTNPILGVWGGSDNSRPADTGSEGRSTDPGIFGAADAGLPGTDPGVEAAETGRSDGGRAEGAVFGGGLFGLGDEPLDEPRGGDRRDEFEPFGGWVR